MDEGGFRIRMMEPGDAPALHALACDPSSCRAGRPPFPVLGPGGESEGSLDDTLRWLLRHEVFVAETAGGAITGFAAGGDRIDLYWLAGLFVPAGPEEARLAAALLDAVARRARWFFHRAVGLSTESEGSDAPFFETRGFVPVPRQDRPAVLDAMLRAETTAETGAGSRTAMVKWL